MIPDPKDHDRFRKLLGKTFRERRLYLGLTLTPLAEDLNRTIVELSAFERGHPSPIHPREILLLLLRLL